jgi:hypothetical protein
MTIQIIQANPGFSLLHWDGESDPNYTMLPIIAWRIVDEKDSRAVDPVTCNWGKHLARDYVILQPNGHVVDIWIGYWDSLKTWLESKGKAQ